MGLFRKMHYDKTPLPPQEEQRKCPYCGRSYSVSYDFCPGCGNQYGFYNAIQKTTLIRSELPETEPWPPKIPRMEPQPPQTPKPQPPQMPQPQPPQMPQPQRQPPQMPKPQRPFPQTPKLQTPTPQIRKFRPSKLQTPRTEMLPSKPSKPQMLSAQSIRQQRVQKVVAWSKRTTPEGYLQELGLFHLANRSYPIRVRLPNQRIVTVMMKGKHSAKDVLQSLEKERHLDGSKRHHITNWPKGKLPVFPGGGYSDAYICELPNPDTVFAVERIAPQTSRRSF